MNEQISALMDGEIEEDAVHRLFSSLKQKGLGDEWEHYHLIGDVMRDTPVVSDDFMAKFFDRLEREPTVLAPRRLNRPSPRKLALSVVASVAAVGFVAWAAVQIGQTGQLNKPFGSQFAQAPAVEIQNVSMNPYLLAHEEYSPSVSMQGMAPYVRTISEVREVAAR
ncbi:MAG: sigma-E factor negative regulatory protein [Sulfuricellaceae bacterium]|nr:sigma-E factor negative regulatory protein [Sulfuricellaceae bacterium]